MRKVVKFALVSFGLAILASGGFGQDAELLIWQLPTPNAQPVGLAISPDGRIYIAEFNAQKIGRLDPSNNELAERDIEGKPGSIFAHLNDTVVYTLPLEDVIGYLVFTSGQARWQVPTAGAWPIDLTPAPSGPGQINLWFVERTAGKVGFLSPSQIPVTLPLYYPQKHTIAPQRQRITPRVVSVQPRLSPGNPMLPPPLVLVPSSSTGPITEWSVTGFTVTYVEDLALATASGAVWFTTAAGELGSLDPSSSAVGYYALPSSSHVLGVTVAPDGKVWFTDRATPAIGSLDPVTGDVYLWPIPGGVQPLKIAVAPPEHIWFIDREADLVGFLRPSANEFTLYPLPPNSYPVDLALADDGTVWFVCERGHYVASLSIIPVLGPPPTPSGSEAAKILGYSITQVGNRATIEVIYSYNGSLGFPVFVGLYVLPDDTGFGFTPYRIERAGTGTATIELVYSGTAPARTEAIKLVIYLQGGQSIAERMVEFRTTWTP